MAVVSFAAYRSYEATRINANNAMMGLLAGAQLADHLLQLTAGSNRLLPEVFPRVAHIGRFNLTTEAARKILGDAEVHLGSMSVPYALSIHEDYLKTCLSLCARAGLCTLRQADGRLVDLHSALARFTGGSFDADELVIFDSIRRMRNAVMHRGGGVNTALVTTVSSWNAVVRDTWLRFTQRDLTGLQAGDSVSFGQRELILTLAVTKGLARQANELLQPALPRSVWADLLIEDLYETHPGVRRAPDLERRARGYARHAYGPLALTSGEVAGAIARTK